MRFKKVVILLISPFLLLGSLPAEGQFPRAYALPPQFATDSDFGGSLVFCRGFYLSNYIEAGGRGWITDYPKADMNLLTRISELTRIKVQKDPHGRPVHVVVALGSPVIFNCPLVYMVDVGTIRLTEQDVANLRLYLEKGGFLWVDDFWGTRAWENWERQIRRILPSESYRMIDITKDHPIMRQLYTISEIPQITNIEFWYQRYYMADKDRSSERGEDSREVHFRGIENEKGELLIVMTHNTDIGDTWEEERSDLKGEFFYKFASAGYAVGINIFIYALTH